MKYVEAMNEKTGERVRQRERGRERVGGWVRGREEGATACL